MKKSYFTKALALRTVLSVALMSISAILIASTFALPLGNNNARINQRPSSPSLANFTYTTIDVCGATNTILAGNNNFARIVGGDALSNGTRHGFLDNAGIFTTIDDPNATVGTEAADINA